MYTYWVEKMDFTDWTKPITCCGDGLLQSTIMTRMHNHADCDHLLKHTIDYESESDIRPINVALGLNGEG